MCVLTEKDIEKSNEIVMTSSQSNLWKVISSEYVATAERKDDEQTLIDAIAEKYGKETDKDATDMVLVFYEDNLVAGAFLKVSPYNVIVLSHTHLKDARKNDISYYSALCEKVCAKQRNAQDHPLVFGLFRTTNGYDKDPQDSKLLMCMGQKLMDSFTMYEDMRKSITAKNKELEVLSDKTGIQQVWVGSCVKFHFFTPNAAGYERPRRQPTQEELTTISKGVANIKHKQRAQNKKAELNHSITVAQEYIKQIEAIESNLPERTRAPNKSRTPTLKGKPKATGETPKYRSESESSGSSSSDESDESDDDDEDEDGNRLGARNTDECVTPESPRISRAEKKKMKKAKKKKRKAEKSARKAGKRSEIVRQARLAVYEQPVVTVTSH